MIAIKDILIFIAGAGFTFVAILTHRYFYGKRFMYVSNLPQEEKSFKPRKVNSELPPVDNDKFSTILRQINTVDEFSETYSSGVKDKVRGY